MPVVVQCFHCNAILELDEAFRGGVCRCSACGSLLQVPKAEVQSTGREARPATPEIAGPRTVAGPAAESGDNAGISSGAFDPAGGDGTTDAGGASSGLAGAIGAGGVPGSRARIHQTRPISATSSRKKRTPAAPNSPVTVRQEASEEGPETTRPVLAAHGLPAERQLRRESQLFWLGVVLILVIAAVVIVWLVMFVLRRRSDAEVKVVASNVGSCGGGIAGL